MMLLWLGCADPFEHDISDLIDPRIVSVSREDGMMIWSGEGLYHKQEPEVFWYDIDGNEIAQGIDVPQSSDMMFVEAFVGDRKFISEVLLGSSTFELDTQSFVVESDVNHISIEEREKSTTEKLETFLEEQDAFSEDDVWRIALHDTSPNIYTHWYTPLVAGTSLPLSQHSTDIYPFDLQFDDGELVSFEQKSIQAVLLSATYVDEQNVSSVRWKWLGAPVSSAQYIQERWLSADAHIEEGVWYQATIVPDDTIWGISLENVVAIDDFLIENLDMYQDPLPCFQNTMFRFDWVVSGRCALDNIVDAKVVFLP